MGRLGGYRQPGSKRGSREGEKQKKKREEAPAIPDENTAVYKPRETTLRQSHRDTSSLWDSLCVVAQFGLLSHRNKDFIPNFYSSVRDRVDQLCVDGIVALFYLTPCWTTLCT